MSDLLACTGWVGEHPRNGSDVAHILAYPATDFDPDLAPKIRALAAVWELHEAFTGIMEHSPVLRVDLDRGVLEVPGQEMVLPPLRDEWIAAARAQGFVVVSMTRLPLSAPTLPVIDALMASLRRGQMWLGFATIARSVS